MSYITHNHRAGGDRTSGLGCSNDNNKVSSSTTGSQENKQPGVTVILERGGCQLEKLYKRRGILRMIGNLRKDKAASVRLNILC